ncbi:MAG: N-acetylmuramidase domain-containing protein [Thiohalocapsa sp.]|jgi:hypothetical protein
MAIDIEAQVDRILEDAREELLAVVRAEMETTPPEPEDALAAPTPATRDAAAEPEEPGADSAPAAAEVPDHPPRVDTEHEPPFVYDYPSKTPDGRFVPVSWTGPIPGQAAISSDDITELADTWSVNPCHLRAVLAVESAGSGFLLREPPPARPKILFEAHWFYKLTPLPVSKTRPDLSSRRWNRNLYKGGSAEWGRLQDAMEFDPLQALKSASWGLGQVMGFNYTVAGCESMEQFVVENFTGEKAQFNHMLAFIDNNDLMGHLRAGRWASFAKGYNGAGYRANRYDEKLAAAARRCR